MSVASTCDEIPSRNDQRALVFAMRQNPLAVVANARVGEADPAKHGILIADLLRLLDDAGEAIDRDREAARACIARASALLRDDIGFKQAPATLVRGGLAAWQIVRLRAHVEAHLSSTIRVRELAAIARLSTGHFSRAFTGSFGMPPFAYIVERRLARAQDLMLTTNHPLCEIALACGLFDQSHLTRLFRRHTGTTPSAWRRRHVGEQVQNPQACSCSSCSRFDKEVRTHGATG